MNEEGKILDPLQVDEESIEETQEFYKSKHGNFNRYQEGLFLYLGGRKSLVFVVLKVFLFLASLVSGIVIISNDIYAVIDSDIINLNWTKFFYVIIILVSAILPTAYIMLYVGGSKLNFTYTRRGLKLTRGFMIVVLNLMYLAMILSGIFVLFLIFRSFLLGLILGIIIGLIFYFYINYYKVIIEFIDRCILTLDQDMTNNIMPHTDRLRSYYIVFLVLMILSQIINLFSGNSNADATNELYGLDRFMPLVWISTIVSLFTVFYTFYLINNIHDYFRLINYKERKKREEYKKSLTD